MGEVYKYIDKAKDWAKAILSGEEKVEELDQKYFETLSNGEYAKWRADNLKQFDKDAAHQSIKEKLNLDKKASKKITLIKWWYSTAAVLFVAILGTGGYLILRNNLKNTGSTFPTQIVPGKSIAYLEIDNKQQIELTGQDTLLSFNDTHIKLDSSMIAYSQNPSEEINNEYHKINVPANGEFFIKLSDGTKVWINAESSLGFYARFKADKRIVYLSGEAYLEVAHDASRPFIVKTANADIQVLGTKFNVKSYIDDNYTYATLNEGKVKVGSELHDVILAPDEQLVINNKTAQFEKRKVDASVYSAWTRGKLVFKDERLEDILITLSRWYDVSVFYPEKLLKNRRFSVSTNRYDNITTLLDQIELTKRVNFEIVDNAVIVKGYNNN